VKLGLLLNLQFVAGQSPAEQFAERIRQVELARQAGFDLVVCSHHFLSDPYAELQPIPVLARLTAHTGPMRLLTGIVLLPLHSPVEIAEQGATIDVMSGGRFVLGVGVGYRDVELDAFGVPPGEAVRRFVAGTKLIERLWTEERVTHDGPFWRLDDVPIRLRPVQRPRPPIWIAGNSDGSVRRAARLGDAWYVNPHARLDTLERQLDLYRQALAEAGKPFPAELPMRRELYVAPTREAAWRECGPYLEGKYRTYSAWGQDRVVPEAAGFGLDFDELADERFLIGDPDDCVEGLRRCRAMGATTVVLRVQWPGMPSAAALRAIELVGERVLPAVAGL
jgi:alkanesulfonate monooxygenase SsuD/methylene tetrahydromethanopterin reductase-like flavin-dependent oxidoreductase (luciferase family)